MDLTKVPTWYYSCVTSDECGVIKWKSGETSYTVYRTQGRFCDSDDCNAEPTYSLYTLTCSKALQLISSIQIITWAILTTTFLTLFV